MLLSSRQRAVPFAGFLLAIFRFSAPADITPPDLRHTSDKAESALPAAFADVDGDRFTDIILLSGDLRNLLILLGQRDDPVFVAGPPITCELKDKSERIRSVVPGDFDGDETIDIIVTTTDDRGKPYSRLRVFWGLGEGRFDCPSDEANETAITFQDQPLAMDFNGDLIPDILAVDASGASVVWMWNRDRRPYVTRAAFVPEFELHVPHSNAFVDVDGDHHADLVLTGEKGLHVFPTRDDRENYTIPWPESSSDAIGQTAYVDVDADGVIDLLVPSCTCGDSYWPTSSGDCSCTDSVLFVCSGAEEKCKWRRVELQHQNVSADWVFALERGKTYLDTISIRFGDYDIDGFPDFLATMWNVKTEQHRVVLFRNVAAAPNAPFTRSFVMDFDTFPRENTVLGAFFDIRENGLLDVILLQKTDHGKNDYQIVVYENDRPVGYDHYFLKVVVFGPRLGNGVIEADLSSAATNVAGACVSFVLDDFVGEQKTGKAVQQSQTAHFALQMPYVVFGLADVSNFVECLTVGLPINRNSTEKRELSRSWFQLIPNSQVYVIPSPLNKPKDWKIKLYLTPKHLIGRTLLMLWSMGFAAMIIVAIIYWREKMLDRQEKRKEAYMMYFSALRG